MKSLFATQLLFTSVLTAFFAGKEASASEVKVECNGSFYRETPHMILTESADHFTIEINMLPGSAARFRSRLKLTPFSESYGLVFQFSKELCKFSEKYPLSFSCATDYPIPGAATQVVIQKAAESFVLPISAATVVLSHVTASNIWLDNHEYTSDGYGLDVWVSSKSGKDQINLGTSIYPDTHRSFCHR